MNGWRLTFNFREGPNVIEADLSGNGPAVQVGLSMAFLMTADRLKRRLAAGNLPDGLQEDVYRLQLIMGGAALAEYDGKYLKVVRANNVTGLSTSVSVTWSD